MPGRRLWVVLAIALVPQLANADKYDDAFAKTQQAFDAYKAVADKYATLHAKYEQYYAPLGPQWDVVVKARKLADDECNKNKRTKACRDLTLAYAAEHKKYNAMVWDKDNADPKKEFDGAALNLLDQQKKRRLAEYDAIYAPTKKMLEDWAFKTQAKVDRAAKLDAKLKAMEDKRGEKFAAGRSSVADSKNPRPDNSSSSTNGGSSSGIDSGAIMEKANGMAGALGKQ